MTNFGRRLLAALLALAAAAGAGETLPAVPRTELQALQRAIDHELKTRALGSQTLGELNHLLYRLQGNPQTDGVSPDRLAVLAPLNADGTIKDSLARLEREAATGDRAAMRSLTLLRLYQGDPELALKTWRAMGSANPSDVAYRLMSAYLELALGDYNAARASLDSAMRAIETRATLDLSTPVFCQSIAGYRLYDPRDGRDLLPGEDTLIYLEIEGADFHTAADGLSECRLLFGMKLQLADGPTRWADPDYGEYSPAFNGPVRDLHTALSWRIPNDLQPGIYRLHIDVTEASSRRRGDTAMEFTVARRPTNPEPKIGTGAIGDIDQRLIQDANRLFPGATPPALPGGATPGEAKEWLEKTESGQDVLRRAERFR